MVDRRKKNINWYVTDEVGNCYLQINDGCKLAIMMDIRDLLEEIRNTLCCHNCKDIPNILRGIRKKLPTKKKRNIRR